MSGPYRFVEHPAGVWRIEQKGLFFWASVGISDWDGTPFRFVPGLSLGPPAKWKFDTLEEVREALSSGLAKQAVRNIAPFTGEAT